MLARIHMFMNLIRFELGINIPSATLSMFMLAFGRH